MKALDIEDILFSDTIRNEQMIKFHIDNWKSTQAAGPQAAPAKQYVND
jgi:hypothetical protein